MPFDTSAPVPARDQVLVHGASDVERRFMASVYRWMTFGLAITALVAFSVASSEDALRLILGNKLVFFGLIIAEFGLVITVSAAAARLSAATAGGLFLLFAAINGALLSVVLLAYTGASVTLAFASTAGMFLTMSIYATVTRKDLSSWGSFLFMGLIGVVIASLVNIFLKSTMVTFIVSCMSVVVFTGLTAYDTQKLRVFARAGGAGGAMAVNGALALYLDFINLFLALLRLFGSRRE
jgi:FtsH-binding integral membrane protein